MSETPPPPPSGDPDQPHPAQLAAAVRPAGIRTAAEPAGALRHPAVHADVRPHRAGPPAGEHGPDPRHRGDRGLRHRRAVRVGDGQPGGPGDRRQRRNPGRPGQRQRGPHLRDRSAPPSSVSGCWSSPPRSSSRSPAPRPPDRGASHTRPLVRTSASPRTDAGCARSCPTPGAAAGSRPRRPQAWEEHHEHWVIPDEAVDEPGFRIATWFGREAPLIVEIGSGIGEATAALAAARPDHDVLALEVWRPGIADSLWRIAEAGATNVRLCSVDAVWVLEHLVAARRAGRAVDVLPGPVAQDPAPQAAPGRPSRSPPWPRPGSRPAPTWRLATDWAHYADADAGRPRRRAAPRGRPGAPVGRPAGHPVRAQGDRRRPRHHRPRLPAPLAAHAARSTGSP